MDWIAQAPANIALIKYMGKQEGEGNRPDNPSLSYTLPDLLSTVQLERISAKNDLWEPLHTPGLTPYALSAQGQTRFITHLGIIKKYFNYTGSFLVKSTNNFPAGSGLASSASSFAALTKCAVLALSELTQKPLPSVDEQAALSRQGSGSSCRSFYAPWALWDDESVRVLDLPYASLLHQVVIISHQEKAVSSSEAHKRVKTSPLYATRSQSAKEHLKLVLDALNRQDWASVYHLCWQEFHAMHQLFKTAAQPFTYMTEASLQLLNTLQKMWEQQGDGPLVTMDAGPNIHLLYRPDQKNLAYQFKQQYLVGNFDFL